MCGLLFIDQKRGSRIALSVFERALATQSWRGPDAHAARVEADGRFLLGHNRLSIVDPAPRSNQPMQSACGRFLILYNGEVYNHIALRKQWGLDCRTNSDTETVLEGYAKYGSAILEHLEGMFALVVVDLSTNSWIAARDALGIKPLYIGVSEGQTLLGSEPAVLAKLAATSVCEQSLAEWRLIRRPMPGHSFFKGISEVMPGTFVNSDGSEYCYWRKQQAIGEFVQEDFERLLEESVRAHEMSDCSNVALLSGGLDSAIIAAISGVQQTYSIGTKVNNEFEGAADTAKQLRRNIKCVETNAEALLQTWIDLARLRGEPLSVPNEGLIFLVCKAMEPNEKVVLTGEGADELLFGYDNIFRRAVSSEWNGMDDFLKSYGYASPDFVTARLSQYITTLRDKKTNVEFMEDFFYEVHLTGLLRRMDFSSMAASKEARVPFVNKNLVNYMYRRPSEIKITKQFSKIPIRVMAHRLNLGGVLNRKKVGFSATLEPGVDRFKEYEGFQMLNLEALGWT